MFDQVETGEGFEPPAARPALAGAAAPAGRDGDVWDAFARRHGRTVSRCVVRAMVRAGAAARADEVQELVQEVYCRLLERGDVQGVAGRPEAQLWCYLQRIAHSVVVDHLRARHARKRGGWPPRGEGTHRALAPAIPDDTPATHPSPEERAAVRERVRHVRRRVRQAFPGALGERNLRVLELAAIEGLTAVEIAQRLRGELTPSSVHTVLHRMRRLLAGSGEPDAARGAAAV